MDRQVLVNIFENVFQPTVNQALIEWFLNGLQAQAEVTLTDETTYVVAFNSDNRFPKLILGAENLTSLTATVGDLNEGDEVYFRITQDGTGARTIAWGGGWEAAGGTDPTVTASTDAVDVFKGVVHGGKVLLVALAQNIAELTI